jgi:putative FmdB family regulatory protein
MKYLYKCYTCLHEFEKEQKLKDVLNHVKHSKVRCPICKGSTRKIINSTPIYFKGSGWGGDKK